MKLPMLIKKPWGHEEIWAHTGQYAGKILFIRKAHRLSRQYHRFKEETILVLRGVMILEFEDGHGNRRITMGEGDSFHIPPHSVHRMAATEDCMVMEVSTPQLDDVVRIEDDYERS